MSEFVYCVDMKGSEYTRGDKFENIEARLRHSEVRLTLVEANEAGPRLSRGRGLEVITECG